MPTDTPSGPGSLVRIVEFTLCGQPFTAMTAGPMDAFNHAISFVVRCDDQAEVDRYWDALIADGGQPERCGWLKDRFGLSWQVVPTALQALVGSPDRERAQRATDAMLRMTKIDIAAMQAAFDGEPA